MSKTICTPARGVEPLESRLYRDSSPWAWNAVMIHQDQAVADFPLINGAGQTIVILDTGLDESNATFAGKTLTYWQDFIGTKTSPIDNVGHGTGNYGIIAGDHFDLNGFQEQGIAQGANIIMLRTDTEKNTTPWATQAQRIANALDWVIANQAAYNIVAVNMSTGGPTGFTDPSQVGDPNFDPNYAIDQVLQQKFATLGAMGVFMSAAAGNDGDGTQSPLVAPDSVEYPAADPNVYAASSVNANGNVSSYASRGVLTDILAPGENVYMPYGGITGTSYINYGTGTSFSAPALTAAAALLKQIDPNFTPAQIMQILQQSGTPVTDSVTGNTFALLNLDAAIKLAYSEADDLNNHTLGTATHVAFNGDTASLSDLTSLVGTHDYYSFTLTRAASVTFSLSTTDGSTLGAAMLNASGTSLGSLTDGQTITLTAGTYYVRIDGGSQTLDGTYGFALNKVDTDDLDNHTFGTASLIDMSNGAGELTGLTLLANVTDYYKFVVSAKSNVNLSLTSDGTYPTVTLLSSIGAPLGTVSSGGLAQALDSGTYYVSVSSGSEMTYNVSISAAVIPPPVVIGANATAAKIAYDNAGNLYLAYYDGASKTLKFNERDSNGNWGTTTTVDSTIGAGTQLSIAVDANGNPAIAYYASGSGDLKFAHFNGSTWDVTTVDYYKTTGLTPSLVYASDGTPLIAYYDQYYGQLRIANQVGSRWGIYTVDSGGVGLNASIAYDSAVSAYGIGYENVKTGALKYATYYRRAFRTSTIDATTTGGVGQISMAISDTTHNPAVSYYDVTNADLVYAAFNGRGWAITHVAARSNQGQYSSLAFNNGIPDIVYYAPTYAAINNASLSGSLWSVTRISSGGVAMAEASNNLGDDTLAWIDSSGIEFFDLS